MFPIIFFSLKSELEPLGGLVSNSLTSYTIEPTILYLLSLNVNTTKLSVPSWY